MPQPLFYIPPQVANFSPKEPELPLPNPSPPKSFVVCSRLMLLLPDEPMKFISKYLNKLYIGGIHLFD